MSSVTPRYDRFRKTKGTKDRVTLILYSLNIDEYGWKAAQT